jgi:serine/threonine-protein kinase RsbW
MRGLSTLWTAAGSSPIPLLTSVARQARCQEHTLWTVGCRQGPRRCHPRWVTSLESKVTGDTIGPAFTAVVADRAVGSTVPQIPDYEVQDRVTIQLPADGAYLSVLRTATAGLAARLDFTLDEIEDLRIAVDEACGMLLAQAVPGSSLDCDFTLEDDRISITVSAISQRPRPPARDTFAWTVLSALAGSADASVSTDGRVTVMLRKVRESSRSG